MRQLLHPSTTCYPASAAIMSASHSNDDSQVADASRQADIPAQTVEAASGASAPERLPFSHHSSDQQLSAEPLAGTSTSIDQPVAAEQQAQAAGRPSSSPPSEALAGLSVQDKSSSSKSAAESAPVPAIQNDAPQETQPAVSQETQAPDDEELWPIKWIQWPPEVEHGSFPEVRGIIMQRHNGPCSFIGER